jgi:hypothetical protein
VCLNEETVLGILDEIAAVAVYGSLVEASTDRRREDCGDSCEGGGEMAVSRSIWWTAAIDVEETEQVRVVGPSDVKALILGAIDGGTEDVAVDGDEVWVIGANGVIEAELLMAWQRMADA